MSVQSNNVVLGHAFGSRCYPAMVEKIRFGETPIRQQALTYLYHQFHKQENIFSALQADIVPALIMSLRDINEHVREEAAKAFSLLASNITARSIIINQKALPVLLHSLKDPSDVVKLYSHKTFTTFTMNRQGALAAIDSGLVPELLSISESLEDLDIMVLLLESLNNCTKLEPNKVLGLGGLTSVMAILQKIIKRLPNQETEETCAKIKYLCSECIAGLCAPYEGKAKACESNEVIEALIQLACDNSQHHDIQTSTTGALMNVTVRTEGKWIAINAGISKLLLDLVLNPNVNSIYIIKTVTNIAEDPEGRKQLQPAIPELKRLIEANKGNDNIIACIRVALSKLMFVS